MATDLGKAYVQIVPSADGISGSISKVLKPEASKAGSSAGTTVSKSMGEKVSALGGKFVKAGAIATAVSVPIVKGMEEMLSAYEVQESAEQKLTEIYKTRMGASEGAAQKTMELASALQQQGIIGDEVALSGAQQLATFANYPDTINTLLPAMENLLAQQKGVNATTDDAVNIGNLMGKVMQGQTGALKRVGISFTSAQEDVLKYGTEQERAAMLAEVITSNVGNMNETLANTPSGRIQQLKNSLGDMKEEIGAALAPVVAKLAQYVSANIIPLVEKLIGFIQSHPIIGKIAVGIAGLLAVGGPLLIMLGSIMTIAPLLASGFSALLGPVGLVIAALAAAVAIGVALYKNWDKIKAAASKAWEKIKNAIVTPVKNAFAAVKDWFKRMQMAIGMRVNLIKDKVKNVFASIKEAIVAPIRGARDAVKKIIDKIKSFFDFDFKLPEIKLPHVYVDPKGWSIGDIFDGVIPSLGIDWYAKGGIVSRPTVLGAGDVRGGEGIVPLTPFWNQMQAMADDIISGVATVAAASAGGYGDISLDVYLYPNGPKMMEETVKAYDKGKKILG